MYVVNVHHYAEDGYADGRCREFVYADAETAARQATVWSLVDNVARVTVETPDGRILAA